MLRCYFLADTEGELAIKAEDNGKIISEITVFDHIREKAKSFPVLSTSNSSHPSSSQLLNLTRKRRPDNLLLEPHCEIVVENLDDNIPKDSVFSPLPVPSETGNSGFNINDHDPKQPQEIRGSISTIYRQFLSPPFCAELLNMVLIV